MSEFSHVFKMGKDLKTIQYVASLGDPDSLKHSSGMFSAPFWWSAVSEIFWKLKIALQI